MKRILIGLAAVAVLAATAPDARALSAQLGVWDAKGLNTGFGIGIKHKFLPIPLLRVEGRASWYRFSDATPRTDVFPLEILAAFGKPIYFGGALSYNIIEPEFGSIDNSWGTSILAGVNFGLAGLGVFAEGRYTWLKADGETGTVNMNGFGASAGVSFGF